MPSHRAKTAERMKEKLAEEQGEEGGLQQPTTLFGRLSRFVRETVFVLLTTTETLEDKAFEDGGQYFTMRQLAIFGIMKRLFFLFALFWFFTNNFIQAYYKQQFISLDPNSGVCTPVPKPWTIGQLQADIKGYWAGELEFEYVYAAYSFSLFDFQNSITGYTTWMAQVSMAMKELGQKTLNFDLATNLVYWSSWSYTLPTLDQNGNSVDQIISLSGDPVSIMNFLEVQGTIANVNEDCRIFQSSQSYNPALGTLITTFDITGLNSDRTCNSTVNPKQLGWSKEITGNVFTMTLDVRTLFSCMAVTLLVNGDDTLDYFVNIRIVAEGTFNGVTYQAIDKYDTQYPGMAPMTCIGPKGGASSDWNCVIRMGNSYGIPFFNHQGSNPNYPTKCDCTNPSLTSIPPDANMFFYCNKFDFLSGIIVYDIGKNTTATRGYSDDFKPFVPLLEVFYVQPSVSAKECNDKVFYPAFAALAVQANTTTGYQSSYGSVYRSHSWRDSYYNFTATNSFGYGSIVLWRAFSDYDKSVTSNFFQLANGACADVAYHSEAFDRFKTISWGNLEEDFYRCTQTAQNAVFSSLGVSTGTASALAPVIAMILIYITMSIMTIAGHKPLVASEPTNGAIDGDVYEGVDDGTGEGGDDHVIDLDSNSRFVGEIELAPLPPSNPQLQKFGEKAQMKKPKGLKKKKKTEEEEEPPPPPPEDAGCVPGVGVRLY